MARRKPQGNFQALLVVYPTLCKEGHHKGGRELLLMPRCLSDTTVILNYGWAWKLQSFNTEKDFSPFEVVSQWIYFSREKAYASGAAAAKLLKIKLVRATIAQPYTEAEIEEDKGRAAWHDGTRVDGAAVGRRHL
jgi:hypothetical protein